MHELLLINQPRLVTFTFKIPGEDCKDLMAIPQERGQGKLMIELETQK